MTKLDTRIQNQKNIIENINNNIININNILKNIKSELKLIKNFTKNINKQNEKNNAIIENNFKKEIINNYNKDKKKSFCSFDFLESYKEGILKLLFGINLITMIIAIYIWNSISILKIELGVEKINEVEFNKKLMVFNMVNELSVSSFNNIKRHIEKKINSKEKNN